MGAPDVTRMTSMRCAVAAERLTWNSSSLRDGRREVITVERSTDSASSANTLDRRVRSQVMSRQAGRKPRGCAYSDASALWSGSSSAPPNVLSGQPDAQDGPADVPDRHEDVSAGPRLRRSLDDLQAIPLPDDPRSDINRGPSRNLLPARRDRPSIDDRLLVVLVDVRAQHLLTTQECTEILVHIEQVYERLTPDAQTTCPAALPASRTCCSPRSIRRHLAARTRRSRRQLRLPRQAAAHHWRIGIPEPAA